MVQFACSKFQIGLVSRVVEQDVVKESLIVAESIAQLSLPAIMMCKEAIKKGMSLFKSKCIFIVSIRIGTIIWSGL